MNVIEEETVTLDIHMIENLETVRGGYTKATVEALGISWKKMKKGWKHRLIGLVIPESQYLKAYRGKNILKSKKGLMPSNRPIHFWD